MKVSIKIVGVVGWNTLFDESQGDASDVFNPSFEDVAQITNGWAAASQAITPEANTLVQLKIPAVKTYSSRTAALVSIRQFRTLMKGQKLHVQIQQDNEIQYYPNGVLKSMEANAKGQLVEYAFSFSTQDVTGTQPTT